MHDLRETVLGMSNTFSFLLHCSAIGFALNALLKPWDLTESVRINVYLE